MPSGSMVKSVFWSVLVTMIVIWLFVTVATRYNIPVFSSLVKQTIA